jgi:phage-related protein
LASLTMSGPRAAAIARGTAQWLYRDEECYYTLGVGADASRISLTKIPIGVNSRRWRNPRRRFRASPETGGSRS